MTISPVTGRNEWEPSLLLSPAKDGEHTVLENTVHIIEAHLLNNLHYFNRCWEYRDEGFIVGGLSD